MIALTEHIQLQVSCPTCPESYTVPLSAVMESQQLLDATGPCSGMASYECPAPYLAALIEPGAIAELRRAIGAFEQAAHRQGVEPVLDRDPKSPTLPDIAPLAREIAAARNADNAANADRARAEAIAESRALTRWENEGGAPARDG